jgi:hypothetical protein
MAISRGPVYVEDIMNKYVDGGKIAFVGGAGGAGRCEGGEITIVGGAGGASGAGGAIQISAGQAATSRGSCLVAGDGTRELSWDASKGALSMSQKSETEDYWKRSHKKEKLKLKQHLHADRCMLAEKKQLSQERITVQCSRYDMLSTLIRWAAASATIGSCVYLLS